MADQEIATISQKLQEVKGKFQSIRENGERCQGAIKASQLKPLYLLGDVLEKMGPLTAYVVADGDVTKAEMVDKAQNEHIRTLIKPVQDAFASANGRYEDAAKLTPDTQISVRCQVLYILQKSYLTEAGNGRSEETRGVGERGTSL